MISAAWGVSSYDTGDFPWEPTLTFIASFGAWAFAEFKADAPTPAVNGLHPHDIELGNTLRSLLDERLKRYLREHSFGQTFRYATIDPISELANWTGTEREFVNADLDNQSSEVVRLARELDGKITEYGNPLEHRMEFMSLVPDQERVSDWHSRETSLKIQEVNSIANQLADAGDRFERTFRELSPESYAARGTA